MPELPEVETVRRGLEPALTGQIIANVEQRRPDLRFPLPEHFAQRLQGRKVERLERRGKYLLAHLSGDETLLMHLGMSGSFTARRRAAAKSNSGGAHPHDHVVFHMQGGGTVTYNDPRRFGYMLLIGGKDLAEHPLLAHLGVEPMGEALTAAYLAQRAAGRKVTLKTFLADQRNVAGLGNIYACEALYRARLSPTRAAASIAGKDGAPNARADALVTGIRTVLDEALAAGGSSLRDYRKADGELGGFQRKFCVYGRAGKPCARKGCGGTVQRLVQGGRSTFYCPRCQR